MNFNPKTPVKEPRMECIEYVIDLFYKKDSKLPENTWCRIHGLDFQTIDEAKRYAARCRDGYVYGVRVVELRTVATVVHEELAKEESPR